MSKYLFEVEAKLAVGFVEAQQYILLRFPHCGVCFDMSTLEVKFYLDKWEAEDEDLFVHMREGNLIYGWERRTYVEITNEEAVDGR